MNQDIFFQQSRAIDEKNKQMQILAMKREGYYLRLFRLFCKIARLHLPFRWHAVIQFLFFSDKN